MISIKRTLSLRLRLTDEETKEERRHFNCHYGHVTAKRVCRKVTRHHKKSDKTVRKS